MSEINKRPKLHVTEMPSIGMPSAATAPPIIDNPLTLVPRIFSLSRELKHDADERDERIAAWSNEVGNRIQHLEKAIHAVSDSESTHFTGLATALDHAIDTIREQLHETEIHLKIYVKSEIDLTGLSVGEKIDHGMDRILRLMIEMEGSIRKDMSLISDNVDYLMAEERRRSMMPHRRFIRWLRDFWKGN